MFLFSPPHCNEDLTQILWVKCAFCLISVYVWLPGQCCHQAVWHVNCRNWPGNSETADWRTQGLKNLYSSAVIYPKCVDKIFIRLTKYFSPLPLWCHLSSHHPVHHEQQYKVEVYQQQIDMEKLCHQGELLLKKVSDQTDRDMIQEPLTELRHLWDNLGDKITQRQVQKHVIQTFKNLQSYICPWLR